MKQIYLAATLLIPLSVLSINCHSKDNFPALEHRYLGQSAPGLVPEPFAPGMVSTDEHLESEVLFLPDMKQLSFTRTDINTNESEFIVMQYNGSQWSRKSIPSAEVDDQKKKFSPSVSELKNLEPFRDIPIIGFARSSNETIYYYVMDFKDGSGHLSYSRRVDGQYEKPVKMSNAVNRGKYIAHPFIAPDESYLMWDAEKEGEGTPDIYISFRDKDGTWGEAINMGSTINSPLYEQRPKVTPDGKYLFFWKGDIKTRDNGSRYVVGNPYWVDAKIIETLRPKQP